MHKIKISQRDKTNTMTGNNTVVTIDDKQLEGVMQVHADIKASGVTEITIKMIGDIDIDGRVERDPTLPSV